MSGFSLAAFAMPSSPLTAGITSWPAHTSIRVVAAKSVEESSTTNIRAIFVKTL
jgi:hypothetical protein